MLPACFETRPGFRRSAPQHEAKFIMALGKNLILRSPQNGRLEGRTMLIQRR